jgi:hypothetical protein
LDEWDIELLRLLVETNWIFDADKPNKRKDRYDQLVKGGYVDVQHFKRHEISANACDQYSITAKGRSWLTNAGFPSA